MLKSLNKKKFNNAIKDLEVKAEDLTNKFNGINEWIEDNKNSDPNLYEMIECICEFGELCGSYNSNYKKYDAYPIVEKEGRTLVNYERITDNNDINEFKATHYAVTYLNPNLKEAKHSLDKMIDLRRNTALFKDKIADGLIFQTYKAAVSAEFLPEKEEDNLLRRNILSRCAGIYNFIYQEKQKNNEYKYDNKQEFDKLLKDIRNYEFSSKYAQFTYIFNDVVNEIKKDYLYSYQEEIKEETEFDNVKKILENNAAKLTAKFNSISKWIKDNPNTDPNIYQIIECYCDFGKLNTTYSYCYDKYDKFPIIESDEQNITNYERIAPGIFKGTRFSLRDFNPELKKARESLSKMVNLRYNSDIFKDTTFGYYMWEIAYLAETAYFSTDINNDKMNDLQKSILTKIGGIYNYIYQQKKVDPNFKYDNKEEFDQLNEEFNEFAIYDNTSLSDKVMQDMINEIDKNYLYSENKDKILTKIEN